MSSISIKRTTINDLDILFGLINKMVEESILNFAKPSKSKIKSLIKYKDAIGFISFNNDVPSGFINAIVQEYFFSDYIHAMDLGFFVLKEYRGTSASLRLIKQMEKTLKEKGIKKFCMGQSVGIKIEETKSFYLRNGYSISGFNTIKDL